MNMLRLEGFVTESERAAILAEVAEHRPDLRRVEGKVGLGPRYSVIPGDVIAASLPGVAALGERVRQAAEAFAGAPVAFFGDPVRRMRVQVYDDVDEGFRWHFDGHPFAAVVTLENGNDGVTEIIGPRLSALVRPLFYLAYPFPQLVSLLPRLAVEGRARDVLLLRGRTVLHRGRSRRTGRRIVLVFAFDYPDAAPSRISNWFARWANY
ncbi:MAG TPA: hypothetical protein VGR02_01825 [Thermoanaerobaculia bacterium]|nr:hypothetical protein [Thermoanaerobaculia bacterium]